jgi:NAD(P)-dependent dehydrogenase (short-subunit alcohol dehydrogenase family)
MSPDRFSERRALVTGAGSGIGRATARQLVEEGARVVGIDRDEAGLVETFDGRPGASWQAADVRASDVWASLGDVGPVDILVNAAGVLRRHAVLEHPREDWDATLDVNLKAAWRLSREFARERLSRGAGGAIVNVCSIESFTTLPAHVAYTVSKAALLMLTRAFALELAPHGIRVNGIAPGVTETAMNRSLRADQQRAEALRGAIPMSRFGRPEDQAAAICFLASDDAAYITGAVLPVDGGWLTQ